MYASYKSVPKLLVEAFQETFIRLSFTHHVVLYVSQA